MPPLLALRSRLRTHPIRTTLLAAVLAATGISTALADTVRVACIGDYGWDGPDELAVANLVDSWYPDAVITVGDNSYGSTPIDDNVGQYYAQYIGDYVGDYGPGAPVNRFFPTLGNHDYGDGGGVDAYLDYFTLPGAGTASTNTSGTETYYDVRIGPVHFFGLDSNSGQDDGRSPESVQGQWLQAQLAASTAPWNIVYFHHCPYSSGDHGNEEFMQWPFEEWGADAVFSGHDHDYERLQVGGIPYFVNGVGGKNLRSFPGDPIPETVFRQDEDHGAVLITASESMLSFEFWTVVDGGTLLDSLTIGTPAAAIQFDAVPLGEEAWAAAEIRNHGTQNLQVLDVTVEGPEAADFTAMAPGLPFMLTPGQSYHAAVRFAPIDVGPRTATLVFTTDDPEDSRREMSMSGPGVYSPISAVVFEETGGGASTSSWEVTTDPITAFGGDVYLAAVASKSYVPVSSVTGLGATWSLVRAQCSGRGQTGVDVWMGEGATADGSVTAEFSSRAGAASIVVTRYSGGDPANRFGSIESANTNGVEGSCSGGSDEPSYELDIETSANGSVVFGAVAMRHRDLSPGDEWTLRDEARGGSGGATASVAVVDRSVGAAEAMVLDGSFSADVDWSVIGVEIRGGSGEAPHVFVDPRTVDFGRVTVGEAATITVQIRNDGTADLVGEAQLSGATSPDLAVVSGSGPFTLGPGHIRLVRVRFAPMSDGVESAQLRVTTNDASQGLIDVAIVGEGTQQAPEIVLTPESWDFGNVPIAIQSGGATFVVANEGDADLHVDSVELAGAHSPEFALDSGGADFTLSPGETRVIVASFRPTSLGPKTAELRVESDGGPAVAALSGTGILPPEDVTFVDVVTGGSSGGTVTSDPLAADPVPGLYLAAISSKNYRPVEDVQGLGLSWSPVREQCGARSQTGMSVFMAYGASSGGPVTATFTDDPAVSVIAVSHYAGVDGVEPLGNVLSANTLGVDGVCSGGEDDAEYVLDFPATTAGAAVFSAVGLRSRDHSPGDGFVERAYLVEGSDGTAAGLAVQDRAVESPGTIVVDGQFSGTVDWSAVAVEIRPGTPTGGQAGITVVPALHDYGDVTGGTLVPHTFLVVNDGGAPLAVETTELVGADATEFTIDSGGAPFALTPGETRDIVVSFAPTSLGSKSSILRLTSNAPGRSPLDLTLTGTGVAPPQPTEITHRESVTGTSTGDDAVSSDALSATTGDDLHLAAVSTKPHRSVDTVEGLGLTWTLVREQCGAREQAGMSVFMARGMSAGGEVTATFDDAPDAAAITVSRYSGADGASPLGNVESANTRGVEGSCSGGTDEDAYSLDFDVTAYGAVVYGAVGLRSQEHLPGDDYTERSYVVAGSGGSTAGIAVEDRLVDFPGTVVVDGEFNGDVDWALVALEIVPAAAGGEGDITVAPASHDWGSVIAGTIETHTFVVENAGTGPLSVTGTEIVGADAAEFVIDSGGAPFSLGAEATRDLIVRFAPTGAGAKTATLRLTSDDPDEGTLDVALLGAGITAPQADIVVTPSSHDFGGVGVGSSSSYSFQVHNAGDATLGVAGTDVTGPDAAVFAVGSGGAPFALAPGESRLVTVDFVPVVLGAASATLQVTSDDPDEGTVDVPLSGTGAETPPPGDLSFVQTVDGGSSGDDTVTSDPLPASSGSDLYLAAVSAKSHRSVLGVEGLGLAWTLVREQCGARTQTGIAVFQAVGASSGGPVTATFDDAPDVATIVVSRYSGADPADPLGSDASANTLGADGPCSGGVDGDAYSVDLATGTPGAVVFGAVAVRSRTPAPGSDWEERTYVVNGSGGTSAGIVVQDRAVPAPSTVAVDGDIDGEVDWAIVAVEIRPAPAQGPAITIAPSSHDFGNVTLESATAQAFEARNDGDDPVTVSATELVGAGAGAFKILSGAAPFELGPGETRTVSVEFSPVALGPGSATFRVVGGADTLDVPISGEGVEVTEPDVAVAPLSHDFGGVLPGETASASFEIRNEGTADLAVGTTGLSGPGAAAFAITAGAAPFVLAPGETRDVSVDFAPAALDTSEATLTIGSDDPDEPSVDVALAGVGVEPDVAVTPASHDFGNVLLGGAPTTSFEIRNDGTADLTVSATDLGGPDAASFDLEDGAPFVLAPGESRTVSVTFTPTELGTSDATLGIASDDPDEPSVDVALTGTGVQPDLTVTPASWDFGDILVGTTASRVFEVRNDGTAELEVVTTDIIGTDASSFGIESGGAPFTLTPGESRELTVAFAPGGAGVRTATLRVTSDVPGEPALDVGLAGSGAEPDVAVEPLSLAFGEVRTGSTASDTVRVRNDGTSALTVAATDLVGPDADAWAVEAGGAPFVLAPGETRDVSVRFAPAAPGSRAAALRIASDDPDEAVIDVVLTGTGVEPDVAVTPAAHDFGSVLLGDVVSTSFEVRNDGSTDLAVTAAALTGPDATVFAIIGGEAPFTLGPGETRDVVVEFAPGELGPRVAALSITSDDPDEATVEVGLVGAGVQPDIAVTPASYDFGNVPSGESASVFVEVRNDGTAPLTVTGTTLHGPGAAAYVVASGGAPFALAPGQVRNVSVGFTPPGPVASDATLRVTSDDPDEATIDVALTGTGIEPEISVTPASHDFGDVLVGSTVSQVFQVRNEGSAGLDVTATDLVGPGAASFVIESGGAPFTLSPGAARDLLVRFVPDVPGARTATLRVASDDPGGDTLDVSLVGVGVQGDITVAPASHDYGEVLVGTSASRLFAIRNDGTAGLDVHAAELTGADASSFSIEGLDVPTTLVPGDSLAITVRFAPAASGAASAGLRITSDDADEGTVDVPLAGTGVEPDIAVSPLAYDWGDVLLGDSVVHDFEIRNDGSAPLEVVTTEVAGLDASSFSIDGGGAPFTVAPGASHLVSVRFAPIDLGPAHASLRVTSDDPDQALVEVALDGSAFGYGPDDIVFRESESGGSTTTTVETDGSLAAVEGHLYLAAISTRDYRATVAVSGLGLAWSPVASQCSAGGETGIDVWMAQGTPSGDERVTATLASDPKSAAIVVTRYSGVDDAAPLGDGLSVNENGLSGDCSDGPEASGYSMSLRLNRLNSQDFKKRVEEFVGLLLSMPQWNFQ